MRNNTIKRFAVKFPDIDLNYDYCVDPKDIVTNVKNYKREIRTIINNIMVAMAMV